MVSLSLLIAVVTLAAGCASGQWPPYYPPAHYYGRMGYPHVHRYPPVPPVATESRSGRLGQAQGQQNGDAADGTQGQSNTSSQSGQRMAGNEGTPTTSGAMGDASRSQSPPNPPDAIAFSANRKTSQFFFQRGPVVFNEVTTNIGGGYNADYAVFTAFESGIYLVSYSVVSQRGGAISAAVDLLKNDEVINSASGSGPSGETSNSAVLFLNRLDQLSVQGRPGTAVYCGARASDAFCSFTVALLKIGSFTNTKQARPVPGW